MRLFHDSETFFSYRRGGIAPDTPGLEPVPFDEDRSANSYWDRQGDVKPSVCVPHSVPGFLRGKYHIHIDGSFFYAVGGRALP